MKHESLSYAKSTQGEPDQTRNPTEASLDNMFDAATSEHCGYDHTYFAEFQDGRKHTEDMPEQNPQMKKVKSHGHVEGEEEEPDKEIEAALRTEKTKMTKARMASKTRTQQT